MLVISGPKTEKLTNILKDEATNSCSSQRARFSLDNKLGNHLQSSSSHFRSAAFLSLEKRMSYAIIYSAAVCHMLDSFPNNSYYLCYITVPYQSLLYLCW